METMFKYVINENNVEGSEYIIRAALDKYSFLRDLFNHHGDVQLAKQNMLGSPELMSDLLFIHYLFFSREASSDIIRQDPYFDAEFMKFLEGPEILIASIQSLKSLSYYHETVKKRHD